MSRPRTADPGPGLPSTGPLRLTPWQHAWVAQQLQTLPPRQRLWRLLVLALADGTPCSTQDW
jgi:beta-N-acetylhexosaminidase